MSNYFKITDATVAAEVKAILDSRVMFLQNWINFAKSLGFANAYVTKGQTSFVELEFIGFVATQEQFQSIDRAVYKFLKNIRGKNLKEYSVWGFRRSNKKAYKAFLEGAPYQPNEILTLVDLQEKLVKNYSPLHGVGETHQVNDVIIFGVGGICPVEVKEGIAEPILESEFLALLGR
nr:hypothetical protein [uncultured Acinetobacter sp.]